MIKAKGSRADGTEYMLKEFEYDSRGNMIKESSSFVDLGSSYIYEYEYDASDRLVKQTNYSDGVIKSIRCTEYDDYGNIIKMIEYNTDESLSLIIENEYIELQDYLTTKEAIDQEEIKIVNTEPLENILPSTGASSVEMEGTEAEETETSTLGTENTFAEPDSGVWVNSASEDVILGDDEYKGDDPNDK